jgi:YfiH family protein
MSNDTVRPLCEPVLEAAGIPHGFGRRGSSAPKATVWPVQVHGRGVFDADHASPGTVQPEADAIVSRVAGSYVGIVTADCVPILAAAADGSAVAAIHAGWRGLAAGVIERGLGALRARTGDTPILCAVGPAARACCYEIDEPVRRALTDRHGDRLDGCLEPSRSGHYRLDLSGLATRALEQDGVEITHIGISHRVCTICDGLRFESFRRDGADSGRLRHFIGALATGRDQG